jgi:molybdopterin-guanine dinucleotide biosynthesis protein A/molybdopterin converting factor small subunit
MFAETIVVASPEQELPSLPVAVVRDEVPYQGPASGIYHGLQAASGEICFVTSCDVAFINLSLVSYLVSRISNYDVVVPYFQERFQPLHAVYRRSVLPLLKAQLERGDLRPVSLYDKVRTGKVDAEEIRRFDPDGLSFFNMNTPEDYAEALRLWEKCAPSATCDVELFGAARLLAKTKELSLALPQEATLSHVLCALAEQLPILVGRVINDDRKSLMSGYTCNINGLDFVRAPNARINSGDKIFILSADAGG